MSLFKNYSQRLSRIISPAHRPFHRNDSYNTLERKIHSPLIASIRSVAAHAKSASSSPTNKPLEFPCIDRLESRTQSLLASLPSSESSDSSSSSSPSQPSPSSQSGPKIPNFSLNSSLENSSNLPYKLFKFNDPTTPLRLDHGGVLPQFQIAYETWGKLNEKRDNVILLHTGLSASSHAKSTAENSSRGWWEDFIGPGQPLDTNKFFIICTNVLGGCFGSTGPSSIDPLTSKPYATSFPILTIFDMIRAQKLLLEHLDISKLWASVGSSMGGMQSLAFTQLYPESVNRLITISSCARSHPYSIALRFVQRQILMSDPNWKKGYYYDSIPPHVGMKLARQVATISYRSGPEWEQRFGRRLAREERSKNPLDFSSSTSTTQSQHVGLKYSSSTFPSLCPEFSIETYLEHQGERWCLTYDANSLLYISKAMDLFDLSLGDSLKPRTNPFLPVESSLASTTRSHPNSQPQSCTLPPSAFDDPDPTPSPSPLTQQKNALLESQCLLNGFSYLRDTPALVLGVQSDILFPIWQQKEISEFLKKVGNSCVTYYELDAIYGHDTFLLDKVSVGSAVKGHLENIE